MDVWAITVAVLRRWYVFLPLLALTLLTALWVGRAAPEQAVASATVVLVPGSEISEIENPYGGVGETAEVLEIVLDSRSAHEELESEGLSSDYEVEARSQSRIMDLTVTGTTSATTLATADALLEMARQELSDRQREVGIADDAQVVIEVLRAPTVTEVVADGRLRNMAVVAVVGGAASLLATLLLDDIVGLVRRLRRAGRHAGHEAALQDGAPRTGRSG